jgi:hypothetical protein
MDIGDPALRRAATGKLSHALKLVQQLQADMDSWWSLNPASVVLDRRDDERTIDVVLTTTPLPPIDDWYHTAADILQNYRDALNRLTYSICYSLTAPSKPRDISFPIRKNDESWAAWKKIHSMIPGWLQDRFYAFQPYVSGREYLSALTESNNIEKHADGFKFAVTLSELHIGPGSITVEGLWDDHQLEPLVSVPAGDAFDIRAERQVIATIEVPARITDIGVGAVEPIFAFTPMMRFGDEEIPLLAAIDRIGREVTWAIAYITGTVETATEAPTHFEL